MIVRVIVRVIVRAIRRRQSWSFGVDAPCKAQHNGQDHDHERPFAISARKRIEEDAPGEPFPVRNDRRVSSEFEHCAPRRAAYEPERHYEQRDECTPHFAGSQLLAAPAHQDVPVAIVIK